VYPSGRVTTELKEKTNRICIAKVNTTKKEKDKYKTEKISVTNKDYSGTKTATLTNEIGYSAQK
jgi:hypothetical protein